MRLLGEPGPTFVVRVEPPDGAAGVSRDAPLLARFSYPLDPLCLSHATVQLVDGGGVVPARLELSRDGLVLICRPERLLTPGVEHRFDLEGLRDRRGREVEGHSSRFVPGSLSLRDLGEEAC